MKKVFSLSFFFVISSLFGFLAPYANGEIRVTATTSMIGDLVRNVGGKDVIVETLMGPGVDPHLYKATYRDIERLQGADVVFYNGLHLEGKMVEILEKLSREKKVIPVTRDIPEGSLRKPPEFDGNFDPHVWFDVQLWILCLGSVEHALSEASPAHAESFRKNAAEYRKALEALDQDIRASISTIPVEQRVLVTAHDAFGYFGRAYNIEVAALQGISTATEYGLHDVTRIVDLIIARKIKAVFVEASVPEKFVQALQEGVRSRGHEVKIGGTLFSDSMGAPETPEGNYPGMVRHNVKTIVEALK